MDQHPETEAVLQPDHQDVEGHSLLIEAQGREMIDRRNRAISESGASQKNRTQKSSRPSRLRRLLGG